MEKKTLSERKGGLSRGAKSWQRSEMFGGGGGKQGELKKAMRGPTMWA